MEQCISCGATPLEKHKDRIKISIESEKLGTHKETAIVCKQCAIGKSLKFKYTLSLINP